MANWTKPLSDGPELTEPQRWLDYQGLDCSEVVKVWSAGDSDFGKETILYRNGGGAPMTLVVLSNDVIVWNEGWDWFDVSQVYTGSV